MAPVVVRIEYCSSCGYRSKAEEVRQTLNERFGSNVAVDLRSGRGGSFEVSANDQLLHSKLGTGKWITPDEVANRVAGMMDRAAQSQSVGANVESSDAQMTVQSLLTQHNLLIFSNSEDPYCKQTKDILTEAGGQWVAVELDQRPDGLQIKQALKELTGTNALLPQVFCNGKRLGDNNDISAMKINGTLPGRLAECRTVALSMGESLPLPPPAAVPGLSARGPHEMAPEDVKPLNGDEALKARAKAIPRRLIAWPDWLKYPMFWFPYNIDNNHSRLISACVAISAIVLAACAHKRWAKFYCAFLFVDYVVRFTFGGRASFFGALTYTFAHYMPTRPYPGAPKQFAVGIGAAFAGGATLAFWENEGATRNETAARVLLAILAFAAFLDAVVNFCLGCFFFRTFTRLVPNCPDPAASCDLVVDELLITSEYQKSRVHEPNAATVVLHSATTNEARLLPLIYKLKIEDWKKDDFCLIRHVDPTYWWWPVGMVGIAACFKFAEKYPLNLDRRFWIVLVIMAAVVFGFIFLLNLLQFLWHPLRTFKNWDHPILSNGYAGLPLSIALFALVLAEEWENHDFVKTLFWISAVSMMVLTMVVVSRWIRRPLYRSYNGPDWMAVPVANLVIAATGPLVDADYREVSYLWFSAGLIFWIVLLVTSFTRLTVGDYVYDNMRSSVWIWLAAPSIAFVAYANLGILFFMDTFALVLFYFAVVIFLILITLIPTSYFGRSHFNVSFWFYVFPLEAFAIAWITYHSLHQTSGTHFLSITALCIAIYVCAVATAHTLSSIFTRTQLFTASEVSPAQVFNIFHYAFRPALQKMNQMLPRLQERAFLQEFARLWSQFSITLDMHSRFEDQIYFPALEEYFPGVTRMAALQHQEMDNANAQMDSVLRQILPEARAQVLRDAHMPPEFSRSAAPADSLEVHNAIETIRSVFPGLMEQNVAHLVWEETHVRPVVQKYLNLKRFKELINLMWKSETANRWRVALPFVVNHAEPHFRRLNFLRGLAWAMPERMQLIGQMLYEGVDRLMWNRITVDVPEMIPRHVNYYSKYN